MRRGEGWCRLKLGRSELGRDGTPLPLPIRLMILEGRRRGWLVARVSDDQETRRVKRLT